MRKLIVLSLPILLVACSHSQPPASQPAAAAAPAADAKSTVVAPASQSKSLDVAAFSAAREAHPQYVLLDVRTPAEYAAGHLAGATMIDFKSPDFDQKIAGLDKSKTYLVYCRTGHRSGLACGKLQQLGIDCYNLAGGITAWQAAQMPVTQQ